MMAEARQTGAPPAGVVAAFGGAGPPQPLAGGEGRSYRCGGVVLEPVDATAPAEALFELEATISGPGFRYPRPVRSSAGAWVYRGWAAHQFVAGRHETGRWHEQIATCLAFHRAIAPLPRPGLLDEYGNPWTVADRVAWGERDIDLHPRLRPVVDQLRSVLRPVDAECQLIHGDFGGNLLYARGLPPAVIDFSPYWRPAGFALGVVVADAMVWEGADESLIDAVQGVPEFPQLLARAELRRVLEIHTLQAMSGRDMIDEIDAHLPAVRAICGRCSTGA